VACDRFIYLDLLSQGAQSPAQEEPQAQEPAAKAPDLKRILTTAVVGTSRDDGWSNLSDVGSFLNTSHAAFDAREYGHSKLGELVRAQPYLEVRDEPGPTGASRLWVRLKAKAPRARPAG
jgi:hypothetical protein